VVSIAKSEAASAGVSTSSSSPATCASRRARTREWANRKSGWDCIPAAATERLPHLVAWPRARDRSRRERLRRRHRGRYGYVNGSSGPELERLRRRDSTPDRLFDRAVLSRRRRSPQPSLVASADRSSRPNSLRLRDVAERSSASSSLKARTPTRGDFGTWPALSARSSRLGIVEATVRNARAFSKSRRGSGLRLYCWRFVGGGQLTTGGCAADTSDFARIRGI